MRAVLFRKVIVDGINYYQLFKVDHDFNCDPLYADYDNRASKDFFYIEIGSGINIPRPGLLKIYKDNGNQLEPVQDSDTYDIVFDAFKDKYHIPVRRVNNISKTSNAIKRKILFQDVAIRQLVGQIYLNQSIFF